MSVIALVASKGAPGVTTLACALGAVWPNDRDVAVAECDPFGGDLAARFGLFADSGLTSLVLALRQGSPHDNTLDVSDHVQHLPGGLTTFAGPVGGDAGWALDRELAVVGLGSLAHIDLLADCGRFDPRAPGQQRVLREARYVVLAVRPEASAIGQSRWVTEHLSAVLAGRSQTLGLVVIGDGPYRAADIAETLGVDLVATVPRDAVAASMLCGQPGSHRVLARSPLMGTARRIVARLVDDDRRPELRDAC
jgi:hypothetical protein